MGNFPRKPDESVIDLGIYKGKWDNSREKEEERKRLETQKRQLEEEKRKIEVRKREEQEGRRREEEGNIEIERLKQEHPGDYAAYLANLTYGTGRSH